MGDLSTPIRKRTVVTDEKGNAIFNNLPAGEYTLRTSKEGYLPYTGRVVLGAGNTKVVVSLVPIDKASLSQENERLRARYSQPPIFARLEYVFPKVML